MLGKVKWFNESKGFGFISADGKEYFVHYRSIQSPGFKTLREEQLVSFTPGNGAKGLVAENVLIEPLAGN